MKKSSTKMIKILSITAVALIIAAVGYYFFMDRVFDLTTQFMQKSLLDSSGLNSAKRINPLLDSGPSHQQNPSNPKTQQQDGISPEQSINPSQNLPAPSGQSGQGAAKSPDDSSTQKISPQDLASRVSFEDKRRIMQLVLKKLSPQDITYLMGLLKGGLTPEEKNLAVKLAYSRFTPDELNEIKAYYKKYMR